MNAIIHQAAAPPGPSAAEQLRSYCRQHHTSMRSLSLAIGRGAKCVSDIVNGHNQHPDHAILRALALRTGIAFNELVRGDDSEAVTRAQQRRCLFLDGVIAAVKGAGLAPKVQADLVNDVLQVCRWLDRAPATVPADPVALCPAIADWNGATFQVSEKRVSNVISSLRRALEIAEVVSVRRQPIKALTPPWRALWDQLDGRLKSGDKPVTWMAPALSPFVRYCDGRGIAPQEVTDQIFEDYVAHRGQHSLTDEVERKAREARRAWNRAAETLEGWPPVKVTVPRREVLNLPLEAFPASFPADLAAYDANRGVPNLQKVQTGTLIERARALRVGPADSDGRRHKVGPLNARTLQSHRETALFAASAAVRLGLMAAEDICGIAAIADVGIAAAILQDDIAPRLGLTTGYGDNIVKVLGSMAWRWVPEITAEELEDFASLRLIAQEDCNRGGLSKEDRRRLAQVEDPAAMARLLTLPIWVVEAAERQRKAGKPVTLAMAREVEAAVMCLIEQTLPVRVSTLASTHLDDNLVLPSGKGARGLLRYLGHQVKGGKPVVAELAPWKVGLLRTYLLHYRPRLLVHEGRWLFPGGVAGRHRTTSSVGERCCRLIKDWLGFTINPHLWRKIMGGYLLLHSKNLDLVADLLGHVRGSKATQQYVEMQTRWAAAELDALVTRLIKTAPPARMAPRRWTRL